MSTDNVLDWLSSNAQIIYPFTEKLVPSIPRDLLLDAVVFGGKETDRVYLSKLLTDPSTVFLFFSSVEEGGVVAEFEIPRSKASSRGVFTSLSTFEMRVVAGPGIAIISDALDLTLTVDDAELEPGLVVPTPSKVLSLADAKTPAVRLSGDVLLGAGINMEVEQDSEDNTFRFNAVAHGGQGALLDCPELEEIPRRIRLVNYRQGRTDTRSFGVEGDGCIEIMCYPDKNMIVCYDHCRPCCDCTRLAGIEARVESQEGV